MRCPKCGYISFDRQKSCGKCGNDLAATAEQLRGTTLRGAVPFFLGGLIAASADTLTIADAPQEELDVQGLDPLTVDDSLTETELDLDLGTMEEQPLPPDAELHLGSLDSLEETLPAEIELDLDLAGAPLEEESESPLLPPLGLDEIDVSDLLPPISPEGEPEAETEEMDLELSLDTGEEPPPLPDELEAAQPTLDIDLMTFEESLPPASSDSHPEAEEDEDIVDLSLFMEPETMDAPDAGPTAESTVDLDLALEEATDQGLSLSLEDDEEPAAASEPAAQNDSRLNEIPDLGLTLEMEDEDK